MRSTCFALTTLAIASALSAQQQILLPTNHHLSEAATQTAGSTSLFRTTAGRFQVLYDAPNFLSSGVTGPITINRLRFRGEDTEPNHGGQTYANVTVQLASTSLSAAAATWSTTWVTNFLPATTTAGGVGTIPSLMVAASLGTAPNNYCIDIDLVAIGAQWTHDPTSAQPNLLIEIIMPTPPTPTIGTTINLIPMQDTTGTAAQLNGSCRTSSLPAGATGVTVNPPPVNLEYTGTGGYAALIPARAVGYGAACGGSPSAFYQLWKHNEAFDLANSGLTLTPDNPVAPNIWTVTGGAGAFDATKVNVAPNSILDDDIVSHVLGFNFNYPGGTTGTIRPSTNGHIWLDAGTQAGDFSPTLVKWLGGGATETARLAPCWYDFNCARNVTTHPNSGLHVLTDTSGGPGNSVCYVTWLNVSRANVNTTATTAQAHSVNNLQCVIFEATGVVEFRYGSMGVLAGSTGGALTTAITGFTRGNIGGISSVDPQSRDLSVEVPFATSVEGALSHIGLVAVQAATVPTNAPGRMFAGQSITWNATNVPAGSVVGAMLLDGTALQPGLQLPGIIAPGCMLSTSTGALLWEMFLLPSGTVTGTVPFVVPPGYNPGFLGTEIFAQFVLLDGLFGGPNLITGASHGLKHTVGLQ